MIGELTALTLSDRVSVEVAEMDGIELGYADAVLGEIMKPLLKTDDDGEVDASNPAMGIALSRTYAICSIRKIDGSDVAPYRNIAEYSKIAKRLGAREIGKLQEWAGPIYTPSEKASKKDQGGPSSE